MLTADLASTALATLLHLAATGICWGLAIFLWRDADNIAEIESSWPWAPRWYRAYRRRSLKALALIFALVGIAVLG